MHSISDLPVSMDDPQHQVVYGWGYEDGRHARIVRDGRALMLAFVLLFAAGAAAGWLLRGLWGPVLDQRGWAVLVVFAVVLSAVVISGRREYEEDIHDDA